MQNQCKGNSLLVSFRTDTPRRAAFDLHFQPLYILVLSPHLSVVYFEFSFLFFCHNEISISAKKRKVSLVSQTNLIVIVMIIGRIYKLARIYKNALLKMRFF